MLLDPADDDSGVVRLRPDVDAGEDDGEMDLDLDFDFARIFDEVEREKSGSVLRTSVSRKGG